MSDSLARVRSYCALLVASIVLVGSLISLGGASASAAGSPTWTVQEIGASLNVANGAYTSSISCVSATFCVAGGSYQESAGKSQAFVSTWNGTSWTDHEVAATLNTGGAAVINSVSCVSASFCVAGGVFSDNGQQAFVSTWNGTSWTDQEVAAALNTGTVYGGAAWIDSVSCVSATFCVAGGSYHNAYAAEAFVSTWNGVSWTDMEIVGALNSTFLFSDAFVNSVSCFSATFCVAGGSFENDHTGVQAFVSTWNGTSWNDREVAASLNALGLAQIHSVSCVSATFCVAGGSYLDVARASQAFVSTWNGTSWTDQEVAANLNTGQNVFALTSVNAVSCVTSTFCMAGGGYVDSVHRPEAFVGAWNGINWTTQEVAASLNTGQGVLTFAHENSISCGSPTFCVAGGQYIDSNGDTDAFISTWNGASWTDEQAAADLNTGAIATPISVSCVLNTFCAVGGNGSQAFVGTILFTTQIPLRITNFTHGFAGTPITLVTSGGSGILADTFNVTGQGCSLDGDKLTAMGAANCIVTATNPANGIYATVTSPPVVIHFSLINQRALRIKVVRRAYLGTGVVLKAIGGSGSGRLTFHATGSGCVLRANSLTAREAARCKVHAFKMASGKFRAAVSPTIVVSFVSRVG